MRLTFRLRRLESDEGIEEAQIHGGLLLRLYKRTNLFFLEKYIHFYVVMDM